MVLVRDGLVRGGRALAGELANELVFLVVPPLCVLCREPQFEAVAVCDRCRPRLEPLRDPRCGRCGAPSTAVSGRCAECRGRTFGFEGAWSAFAYEGAGRQLVAALKPRGATAVARFMAAEIAARCPPSLVREAGIVPVPAHGARRRRHGFNPAATIAAALAARLHQPLLDPLVRTGAAVPQVGLERAARLANAHGSVRLRRRARRAKAPPDRVVLVDDVYTTGATLDACSRALTEAGVGQIVAVTFARAVRRR